MKRLLAVLFILTLAMSSQAQIRWPFGDANVVTGGSNDTLDISSQLKAGLNDYTVSNDTSMLINVTTTSNSWEFGESLIISATEATASADTIRYGTNITGLETVIPAGKTKIVTFIYNGNAWVKQAETQID